MLCKAPTVCQTLEPKDTVVNNGWSLFSKSLGSGRDPDKLKLRLQGQLGGAVIEDSTENWRNMEET